MSVNVSNKNRTFTTTELAKSFTLTLRQLQWWDERQIVSPDKSERNRQYSQSQAITVGVLADLRSKGFGLKRLRSVAIRMRELPRTHRSKEIFLICDGDAKNSSIEFGSNQAFQRIRQMAGLVILVSVTDQLAKLPE